MQVTLLKKGRVGDTVACYIHCLMLLVARVLESGTVLSAKKQPLQGPEKKKDDADQIRTGAPEGTRFLVLRDNHSATAPIFRTIIGSCDFHWVLIYIYH